MISEKKEIKTGKKNIADVFKEWYTVPSYQRHYVWEKDNIVDLLDDIKYAAINTPNDEFFLGSYVIQSKNDGNDLLDGQQRITTLFLLFAVLRDLEKTQNTTKDLCQAFVYQEAQDLLNIPNRIRLLYKIRDKAELFLSDNIIQKGSILNNLHIFKENAVLSTKNSPTIQHVSQGILIIKEYFDNSKDITIEAFLKYLLNNVVLIYVSADSLHDAFRFFSILNDRGVRLNNSDIIKSINLQACGESESEKYAKLWEEMQEELGDNFDRFLSFIRTLIVKEKAKSNLLDEFEQLIFKEGLMKPGKDFFDYVSKVYNANLNLFEGNDPLISNNIYLSNLIIALQDSMQSTDWMAALISYYIKFKTTNINKFAQKMTCKIIADWVCGESTTRRIDGINKIIKSIDSSNDFEAIDLSKVFDFDKERFTQNIESDVYGRPFQKPLLILLDFIHNDNDSNKWSGFYQISVEHILPQNPEINSQWCTDFTEEERISYTHKIGNLCLIGRKKNTALGRLDYLQKINKYFKDKIGYFPNSLRIYNNFPTKWNKDSIDQNQIYTVQKIKYFFNI